MTDPKKAGLGEPIAVIGAGCRFAGGATSPSKLWDLIVSQRDVLKEIPVARFNPHGFYNPDGEYHGHSNVKHSYVLDEDHRLFDADFFNISANEAVAIDPQQRLLLETVYEALESAGLPLTKLKGSDTAVFVGMMSEEYSYLQMRELNMLPTYLPTGTARSVVSNRISYVFDWHGPSMTIDTACSSSLVAIHQGVMALRGGESRIVVAAGTNLILTPEPYIAESTFHMLSPQGRSHMWDSRADGYGRGEGTAAIIMKKLSDALADGDHIEYIIRETGVNQDGKTKGITVPSPDAQVDLIKATYAKAGLDLAKQPPQFFEAHGTGTPAGDPLEAEAIHRAIASLASDRNLQVGSVKTNIGHTEGTAGIAGVLKAGMALQNACIPPNMLFKHLNPAIKPFYDHVEIPVEAASWPQTTGGEPRRASVNSFGFGGTNAHAIVESHLIDARSSELPEDVSALAPFCFSANTKASLKRYLTSMSEFLSGSPKISLLDLQYTLSARRSIFSFRTAIAGASVEDLQNHIDAAIAAPDWDASVSRYSEPAQILGVFTGQGAQWPGMGRELIERFPFVKERLQRLESYLAALPPGDKPAWSLEQELLADKEQSQVSDARLSQPLCTAVQILLVDLVRAAGIKFTAVVGHSSGEIACAYAAGVLSARDAIVVAYYRGLHSQLSSSESGQPGAMMAVGTSPEDAEELCGMPQFEGRISLACCNSSDSVTLSGDADAIQEAKVIFEDEGKFARELRVDKAYHSAHMRPCAEPYLQSLRKVAVTAHAPSTDCKWYSSVYDGLLVEDNVAKGPLSAQYWCDNLTRRVTFSAAVTAATQETTTVPNLVLEIGPHGALKGPTLDTIKAAGKTGLPYATCLSRNKDCQKTFTEMLGELWKNGAEAMLNLSALDQALARTAGHELSPHLLKNLPSYQWDHDRVFWHESRRSKVLRTRSHPGHPLLGTLSPDSTNSDFLWHNVLTMRHLPWLSGHAVQGQVVFPAAGYVALAIEAASRAPGLANTPLGLVQLQDLVIGRAITFEDERSAVEMMLSVRVDSNELRDDKSRVVTASFRVHSTSGDSATTFNAGGRIIATFADDEETEGETILPGRASAPEHLVEVDEDVFYAALSQLGYHYSGPFKALKQLQRKFNSGRGYVAKPDEMMLSERPLLVHPGFLDAAFQAVCLALSYPGDGALWSLHIPVSIDSLTVDVAACKANMDARLAFDSAITSVSAENGIIGQLDIFSEEGSQGLIQMEGFRAVPFASATAADDVELFFQSVSGVAFPDGESAVNGDAASAVEIEVGWVLERIAFFYLRRLVQEITPAQEEAALWYHRKLMGYARHVLEQVDAGTHPYGKAAWKTDTKEILDRIMDRHDDKIAVKLQRAVGENIVAAVRGETLIIEHMRKDGMLDEYYAEEMGLKSTTQFLAEIVAQISHVHPHMQILEIGAGTGAATKSVLPRIGKAFSRYCFTDISPGFFETARGVFAEYEDRMDFRVLDAEKDIVGQGYQEGTFDLIVASLVLHATKDLKHTLSNVRKLLRPGGYLVVTEITNTATIRATYLMGGVEGWWLGADSGRTWTPCVTSSEWHELMLETGFTGVEASTPERDVLSRPCSVLVTRASDEQVELLTAPSLGPSAIALLDKAVIITGSSLAAVRLARSVARQLAPHCDSVNIVPSLESLLSTDLTGSPAVLNLSDWDEPVFQNLTPAAYDGLQLLFSYVDNMVWATKGARQAHPHANVSRGFVRAMAMERPQLKLHSIDFDPATKMDATILVDELLRLPVLRKLQEDGADVLWSDETEVFIDRDGRRIVERVIPSRYFNQCYNASRRHITVDANPLHARVVLSDQGKLRKAADIPVAEKTSDCIDAQILFSSNTPLRLASGAPVFPSLAKDENSGQILLALVPDIASKAAVLRTHTLPYKGDLESGQIYLTSVSASLLAASVISRMPDGSTAVVINPARSIAQALQTLAKDRSITIACVSTEAGSQCEHIRAIHPMAGRSTLLRVLPTNTAYIVDLSCEPSSFVSRIAAAFEHRLCIRALSDLSMDEAAWAQQIEKPDLGKFSVATTYKVNELPSKLMDVGAIIDWTASSTIPVSVHHHDAVASLRPDKTYLLVGLAGKGGLGTSLTEFLVRQGARSIVLSSRSPNINQKWIDHYAAQGVAIRMLANDVTDEAGLHALVAHVRATGPPIGGVANGAMVLHDSSFLTMKYEQMTQVLRPKIEGTKTLDDIFRNDDLDFFIMFSSLASVIGSPGQSNYAAANMFMLAMAEQRRSRGVAASVIDIGMVIGQGYVHRAGTDQMRKELAQAGWRSMSERDVHFAFGAAITAGRAGSGHPTDIITGLVPAVLTGSQRQSWTKLPRFSHLAKTEARSDKSAWNKSATTESVRDVLKRARTQEDVVQILTAAIIAKLRHLLQLSAEMTSDRTTLLQQGVDVLGIDSLVAVEYRSWLLKELEVDMPVLKILGELTIQDLINFAADKLSSDLVPMLGEEGSADLPADLFEPQKASGATSSVPEVVSSAESDSIDEDDDGLETPSDDDNAMADSVLSFRKDSRNSSEQAIDNESSATSVSEEVDSAGKATAMQSTLARLSSTKSKPQKTVQMSWSQSRFWVMSQMTEDQTAFNVTARLEITGRLDVNALTNAVTQVMSRHEALRTCFSIDNNSQPVQNVLDNSPIQLEVLDPASSPSAQFELLVRHQYDLSTGETMRLLLIPSTPATLLVGYHHVNMDSSSFRALIQEICGLYSGQKLSLPQLQYSDFTSAQLKQYASGSWERHLQHWRSEFVTPPDPLPILKISHRSSRPRPVLTRYNNLEAVAKIPGSLAKQVLATSKQIKATPFHVHATVFQILLARLADTTEVILGMADANRNAPGATESIGNYLNLLPLRLSFSSGASFSASVKETKAKVLAALEHSEVPFDLIMNEIGARRSATYAPLFQAFIDYRRESEKASFGKNGNKNTIAGVEYSFSKTPYDVMLDVIDKPDGSATLTMLVQEGLYTVEEAQLLLRSYINLLTRFTEDAEMTVGEAAIWDKGDVDAALKIGTGAMLPLHSGSFLDDFDAIAEHQPSAVAVKDSRGKQFSYSQVKSITFSIAQSLRSLGVMAASRVGLLQQPTSDWLVTMLGIWRAGCSYVPLEVTQGVNRLASIVREAELDAIVAHDETLQLLRSIGWKHGSPLVNVDHLKPIELDTTQLPSVRCEDEAMIIYTSGSTGTPKGISIPHRVVTNSLVSFLHRFTLTPQVVLQQTPLSFDVSWWTSLVGLATKGSVVVAPQEARRDPSALTSLIARERISFTFAVPSESLSWLQDGYLNKLRDSAWAFHCFGGELIPFNLIERFQKLGRADLRALNIYGPTETMIPTTEEVSWRTMTTQDMPIPIGPVLPNFGVYVVDEQGRPLPAGIPGHLVVCGGGIANGYVKNPVLSAERFPQSDLIPFAFRQQGWGKAHLSGDYGYLRKCDGTFVLQARIDGDTQVKLRGLRIDMMDIESNIVCASKGYIEQAIVHVRKPSQDTSTHYLAAHVVFTQQSKPVLRSTEDKTMFLERLVKELPVPDYMRPARVIPLDVLPVNAHGKIDRRLLATISLDGDHDSAKDKTMNGTSHEHLEDNTEAADTIPRFQASVANTTMIERAEIETTDVDTAEHVLPQAVTTADPVPKLKDLWKQVLGETAKARDLVDGSDFFAVGGNSLLLIRVQGRIKQAFDIDLPLVQLFQNSTLDAMASLLRDAEVQVSPVSATRSKIDWTKEIEVGPDLSLLQTTRPKAIKTSGLVVALTGSTGFLGKALLRKLVQSSQIERIHCLAVRDVKRLRNFSSPKIVVHQGDLAAPNLGLPAEDANRILSNVDIVIHNGADTSFLKSYATLRSVNMSSTRELARLSLEGGKVQRFHYISTGGIAASLGHDLYEEPLDHIPVDNDGAQGYVMSKWASELFLEKLGRSTNLPVTIHRPTAIIGPDAPKLDVMSSVLHYSEVLGAVPAMSAIDGHFQFVGVERVANDVVTLATDACSEMETIKYKNHCGGWEDCVLAHKLAKYLEIKTRERIAVLDDADWIDKAKSVGLPAEIAAYLEGLHAAYQKDGKQWIFPRVWSALTKQTLHVRQAF